MSFSFCNCRLIKGYGAVAHEAVNDLHVASRSSNDSAATSTVGTFLSRAGAWLGDLLAPSPSASPAIITPEVIHNSTTAPLPSKKSILLR